MKVKKEQEAEGGEEAQPDENKEADDGADAEKEEEKADSVDEPINIEIEGDSDDNFIPIEIKDKVAEFIKKNGENERIPNDIINEAVRWRLNRNDC